MAGRRKSGGGLFSVLDLESIEGYAQGSWMSLEVYMAGSDEMNTIV